MTAVDIVSSAQEWLRHHAELLSVSFRASGLIKHNVTKGQSREHQVLDTLEKLLPTSVAIERSAIIVDSRDLQTSKFDGALVDRNNWPRLFSDDSSTAVVMESVVVALETKSELNATEMNDIFTKAASLREMVRTAPPPGRQPRAVGFTYTCPNIGLSFFDFNMRYKEHGFDSPSAICALGQGVFTFATSVGEHLAITDEIDNRSLAVYFAAGQDSLLLLLYLLSRWASSSSINIGLFRRYLDTAFQEASVFYFDSDFVDRTYEDSKAREAARRCFKRQAGRPIQELYNEARDAIGLEPIAI